MKITQKWLDELDANLSLFNSAFNLLDSKSLNWKPDAKSWSVGQCIHHLITTNNLYFPVFQDLINGKHKTPFMANIPGATNMFGNLIYKSLNEDRKKKYKTFPVFEPSASSISENILNDLEANHLKLKKAISGLSNAMLNASMASPANKIVVYKISKALDIICTHERRHYHQAKEVLELAKLNS